MLKRATTAEIWALAIMAVLFAIALLAAYSTTVTMLQAVGLL